MTVRYQLDPGQSRFIVQAFATGMLSAFAHNPIIAVRDFTGEMQFSPETPAAAFLQIAVRADCLTVVENVNPKDRQEIEDRMRREVLETARYPEICFQSTAISGEQVAANVYRIRFRGPLALHGVTNTIQVDAQFQVLEDGIRLTGEFTLPLSAFRIKRASALGGMITVKDDLKFTFDLVGRKVGE